MAPAIARFRDLGKRRPLRISDIRQLQRFDRLNRKSVANQLRNSDRFLVMQFLIKIDGSNENGPFETELSVLPKYLRDLGLRQHDEIVYYWPRGRGDAFRQGCYFAVAEVASVTDTMLYVTNFAPFYRPVPLRDKDRKFEPYAWLGDGNKDGTVFQKQLRPIEPFAFAAIVESGFREELEQPGSMMPPVTQPGMGEDQIEFTLRRPVAIWRKSRSLAFECSIDAAYGRTCSVSGLSIVDGMRFETERAHFWPVADGGPDSVRNGAPMARTVHWMFDRGLFTIGRDLQIIVSDRVERHVREMFLSRPAMRPPRDPLARPCIAYLEKHWKKFQPS